MLFRSLEKQIIAQSNSTPIKSSKTINLSWYRYAAAIVVGVVVASAIWLSLPNSFVQRQVLVQNVVHNINGTQLITLPDGSQVWLGESSRLTYPDEFIDKKRDVFLEGKAYFDIKTDPNKPLTVNCNSMEIEVVGTEFYVESMLETTPSVALISGKINLTCSKKQGKDNFATLTPGNYATINCSTGEIDIKETDIEYYRGWKDGVYKFTDERLQTIASMLEKYYKIEIRIATSLNDKRFTGRIEGQKTIDVALKIINECYPIKYNTVDNILYINE